MFSRAAKSVVKSFGQRKYHVGENTLKTTVVKAAGGIGQNFSQLLKQTTRLNQLNVYDVARTSLSGAPSKMSSRKSKEQIFQSQENQSPPSLSTQKLLPTGLAVVPVNNRKSESLPSVVTTNQESLMSYFTTCELETDRAIPKFDPLSSEMAAEITSEGIAGNSSVRQCTNSPSLPTIASSGLVESPAKCSNLKNSLNTNFSAGNWKEEAYNWSSIRASPRVLGEMGPSRNSYQNAKQELLKLLPESEDVNGDFSRMKKRRKRKCIKRKLRKQVEEKIENCPSTVQAQSKKVTPREQKPKPSYIHKGINDKIINKGDWMLPAIFDNRKPVLLHNFEGGENIVRCGVTMISQDPDQYNFNEKKKFKIQRDKVTKIKSVEKISKKLCESIGNIEIDNKIRSVHVSHDNISVEKIDCGIQMNFENVHSDKEGMKTLEEFSKLEKSYDKSFPIILKVEKEESESDKLTDHKFESILTSEIFKIDKKRKTDDNPLSLKYPSISTINSYHIDDLYEDREFRNDLKESNDLYLAAKQDDTRSRCNKIIEEYCKKKRSGEKGKEKDPCKKEKEIKKKEDPCKKKEDPCKKKEDPCKKKEDPCKKKEDPCKKKEDPCKKKEDPCKKKEDPCKKKEDPCKKKEDPCKKKEDPCKKKEDPCKKKEDPCKTSKRKDPCEKERKTKDPCKKEKKEKKKSREDCSDIKKIDPCKKKKCPSVIRAPACPEKSKKNKKDCSGCTSIFSGLHFQNELIQTPRHAVGNYSIIQNRNNYYDENCAKLNLHGKLSNWDTWTVSRIAENRSLDIFGILENENENLVVADSQCSKTTARVLLMQEPGDRERNDDYFPLGEEYEDEIGTDDRNPSGGSRPGRTQDRKMDEHYENMIPISLSTKRGLEMGIEKSMLFVRPNPWTGTILDKGITEKDTWERLQTLIDKAVQSSKGLRLGESDCGEGRPDRPKRGPCHTPDGPCTPLPPPGYPSKPRSEKKPFCVKCPPKKPCNPRTCQSETEGTWTGGDMEGSVLKLYCKPQAEPEAVGPRTCRQILGSHGTASGERSEFGIWKVAGLCCVEKPWGLLATRNKRSWLFSVQRGYASRCGGGGNKSSCGKHPPGSSKPPPTVAPSPCPEVAKKREKVPCREEKKQSSCTPGPKSCLPPPKCVPPPPPGCRSKPLNPKCPSGPAPPCPPPCPYPCPPKPAAPPPSKICYKKCPPPPKLPRLPKCVAPPPPPKPPPLPKIPKQPKCPPVCPPPPQPPCPPPPQPPCTPPPQPPCTPPPPPPCTPPPPPPRSPCQPPKECPKPLPCPPPPPPPVCPPCPPCPPCPKPKPCPPSPPCCPSPCPPPPPPPPPCPPPCPPPPAAQPASECPKHVKSCPPSPKQGTKCQKNEKTNKRKMSTYQHPTDPLKNSLKDMQIVKPDKQSAMKRHTRHFKTACFSLFSSSKDCKTTKEICADQDKKSCLSKTCSDTQSQGGCYPDKEVCPKKKSKKKEKCVEKIQNCSSCLPIGKCVKPPQPQGEKITYEPPVCAPPKFAPATPCPPLTDTNKMDDCTKQIKPEPVCPPPPTMPKPPCAPVFLCPCPPPPKLPPGPCPCSISLKGTEQLPLSTPCPAKPKYPCPEKNIQCNLDTVEMVCSKKSKKSRGKDRKSKTKSK